MSLVCGCVCSGNQTSQSFAVIRNDNFTTVCGGGDQISEMIFGFVDVDFVNQDGDILGRVRTVVNKARAGFKATRARLLLRCFIAAG